MLTLTESPTRNRTADFQTHKNGAPQNKEHDGNQDAPKWTQVNVGEVERVASLAAGLLLAAYGVSQRSVPGLAVATVGAALTYRGATGHCHAYDVLGVNTSDKRGIHIEQAYLINRSPEDLYKYWRRFDNLPRIMTHLKSVTIIDDKRSHWVGKVPKVLGSTIEWDAEIIRDEPNKLIGWRSLEGSDIDHIGSIRFTPALGDRGTLVHVFLNYMPPAGQVGHAVAKLLGESPWRQMKEDLRNFKRIMETDEIPTISGQPHGKCAGIGKLFTE